MSPDKEQRIALAKELLQIGAVRLRPSEPFVWASGWKSPIYCDNRLTLSFPDLRSRISTALAQATAAFQPAAETIAGVATAGIPQAALVASQLNLPMVYVRSKPKEHGMGNQIEGMLPPNTRVVVVEDLVSTAKSSLEAVHALRAAGAEVVGMIAIFTYGFPHAEAALLTENVPLITLTDYSHLLMAREEIDPLDPQVRALLEKWRENPSKWMQ